MSETVIFSALDNLRTPFFDSFFRAVTFFGEIGWIWIVLAILLLIFPKTRKHGSVLSIALILSLVVVNLLLKNIVARPRPFSVYPEFYALIAEPSGWSFPSGHTSASLSAITALTVSLMSEKSLKGYVLLSVIAGWIFALMISFSRIWLRVHFPTDVLAGVIIGAAVGAASLWIFSLFQKNYKKR